MRTTYQKKWHGVYVKPFNALDSLGLSLVFIE
jgi:hypothetical protein